MRRLVLVAFCAALLGGFSAPVWAGDLTGEERAADERLAHTVTFQAPEVYVGRLLEGFSRQTGVAVGVGDLRDGTGDFRITIRLDRVPLADAMSALWSLMSYRGAEWDWERSQVGGKFRYRLYRPQRAQRFPDEIPEQIEARFEEASLRMIRISLAQSAEERNRIAADDAVVQKLLDTMGTQGGDRVWHAVRTFAENVPQAKWTDVLRGERYRIPLDKLSPAGKSHVNSELDLHARLREQFGLPPLATPPPTWIEFSRGGAAVYATPSVFLMPEGRGGYATFGGVPLGQEFNDRIRKLWFQSGDELDDPAEAKSIAGPPKQDAGAESGALAGVAPTAGGLLARVYQSTGGSGVSVMALVPAQTQDTGSPYGKTLKAYLDAAHDIGPFPYWKWRHGILLVSEPTWMFHARGNVPWTKMKELREAQQQSGGVLTLDELLIVGDLAPAQIEKLALTFPEAEHANLWLEFFMLMRDRPVMWQQIQKAPGVRAEAIARVLPREVQIRLLPLGGNLNLRFVSNEHLDQNPPLRQYDLVAYTQDGKRVDSVGTIVLIGPKKSVASPSGH